MLQRLPQKAAVDSQDAAVDLADGTFAFAGVLLFTDRAHAAVIGADDTSVSVRIGGLRRQDRHAVGFMVVCLNECTHGVGLQQRHIAVGDQNCPARSIGQGVHGNTYSTAGAIAVGLVG